MKKLYTTISIILIAFSAFAQQQLPNGDFEKWGVYACPGFDTLANYVTSDEVYYKAFSLCYTTPGVSKSTDAQSGTYALSLKATDFFGSNVSTYVSFTDFSTDKGIPFTGRPSKITGYYKFHSGAPGDSLTAAITFTQGGQEFGGVFLRTGESVGSYTKFEFPIYYENEEAPDSVKMFIQIGDTKGKVNANTSALVDNLVFEYSNTGLVDQLLRTGVTYLQKDGYIQFSERVANVRISDVIGNTVFETTADLLEVNVNTLARGLYILTYSFNNQPTSQKIVIN